MSQYDGHQADLPPPPPGRSPQSECLPGQSDLQAAEGGPGDGEWTVSVLV